MEWLNLHTSVLDSPAFLGAEPRDRATWLCLLRYCIGQENSGIIDNCAEWPDRKWQQLCRVTLNEVKRKCDLFEWLDTSLVVKMYPVEKEQEVKRLRSQAKAGADARWDASRHRSGICPEDASRHADGIAQGMRDGICGREGKGKEGKEGGENVPSPSRHRFKSFLKDMRLADDKGAVDEWILLAKELGITGFDRIADMIEFAVDQHRQAGNEARYVRHVENGCRNWAKMKRDTERITKESA